jgi:hypothetical protein
MIQLLQIRLVTAAMQWQGAFTGLSPVGVFVGTLLAGASCLDHYQISSGAYPTAANSCEAPALIERQKAIEPNKLLMMIGEALVPFGR